MPRNEIDYSKTIIYKIVCNDLNITECYVGSTTDFKTRKASHKNACNNEKALQYNYKVYKMIREHEGWDNWSMLQIELYPCKDSNEARARERYWLENMNAKLNVQVPTRTEKEYNAKYYDEHKEDRLIEGKQEIRCEACNCDVARWHLSRHNKTKKHIKNSEPNDNNILNAPIHEAE